MFNWPFLSTFFIPRMFSPGQITKNPSFFPVDIQLRPRLFLREIPSDVPNEKDSMINLNERMGPDQSRELATSWSPVEHASDELPRRIYCPFKDYVNILNNEILHGSRNDIY